MFSSYNLTTCSAKHLEDISHAHIVSLIFKPKTSAEDTDKLSIGLDRDQVRRQREFTNNKCLNGKNHVKIMVKHVFGFAEHQKKGTYGLG